MHLWLKEFNPIATISSTLIAHSKHINDEIDFSKTTFNIHLKFFGKKVNILIITIEYYALLVEPFQHWLFGIFIYEIYVEMHQHKKRKSSASLSLLWKFIFAFMVKTGLQVSRFTNLFLFKASQYTLPHFRSLWSNILISNACNTCCSSLLTPKTSYL